uniref:G_PROTEIN_RECEP_F1_2 domain-containing protein n=1 Tax=Strongyloides papillosus TaxID=174720 RepID=A0A0N5BFV0_STREA
MLSIIYLEHEFNFLCFATPRAMLYYYFCTQRYIIIFISLYLIIMFILLFSRILTFSFLQKIYSELLYYQTYFKNVNSFDGLRNLIHV